jgi:hypothetical protein
MIDAAKTKVTPMADRTRPALEPRDRAWHPEMFVPNYNSTQLRAPSRKPLHMPATLSEQRGPVFGHDASSGRWTMT